MVKNRRHLHYLLGLLERGFIRVHSTGQHQRAQRVVGTTGQSFLFVKRKIYVGAVGGAGTHVEVHQVLDGLALVH